MFNVYTIYTLASRQNESAYSDVRGMPSCRNVVYAHTFFSFYLSRKITKKILYERYIYIDI